MCTASTPYARRGVYGLHVPELAPTGEMLVPVGRDAPTVHVEVRHIAKPAEPDMFDAHRARFRLRSGGAVRLDRDAGTAEFGFPPSMDLPGPDELLHPLLFSVATITNHWHGRPSFHAGAFVVDGEAWVVIGRKGAGKSSTLGWLATHGVPVLSDDLVIIDGDEALAGPACVDLRPDAAARLRIGRDLGTVGSRGRWRHATGGSLGCARIGGWVFLEWSPTVHVDSTPVVERIPRLMHNLCVHAPGEWPETLLRLAGLPCWTFGRPQDWKTMPSATDRLLNAIAG